MIQPRLRTQQGVRCIDILNIKTAKKRPQGRHGHGRAHFSGRCGQLEIKTNIDENGMVGDLQWANNNKDAPEQ